MIGTSLGPYKIIEQLGAGGHCQVNEAVTRSGKFGAVSSLILKQWSPRSKPQRHGHEATGSCGVEVGVGQG